jgi:acyl-CoA synthetase (AMP-forming)/AMP-acid ligase II
VNNANPEFVYVPSALPAIVYPKTYNGGGIDDRVGRGLAVNAGADDRGNSATLRSQLSRRHRPELEGRETSYRVLNELSNQIANGLVATGVRSASRIAILDKNSDIFFQILLGAVKVRAVLVPINARLVPPEISFTINDAQTEVLFVGEAFVKIISAIRDQLDTVRQIIVLNSLFSKWRDAHPLLDPGLPVSPDDVCVQLYTSGTTGYPKGVQLSHANFPLQAVDDWKA